MYSLSDDYVFHSRVSPFGDLGVGACCELTLVFVHLRPSSPSCAKASTLSPLFLDWKYCLLFSFFSLLSGSVNDCIFGQTRRLADKVASNFETPRRLTFHQFCFAKLG